MFESCCFLTTMTIWVVSNHSNSQECPPTPGHGGQETATFKHYYHHQHLLLKQFPSIFTSLLAVPLIGLYSLQLEWLDTIKMVMMVQNNRIQT